MKSCKFVDINNALDTYQIRVPVVCPADSLLGRSLFTSCGIQLSLRQNVEDYYQKNNVLWSFSVVHGW